MTEDVVPELTLLQRKILLETYSLKGRNRKILVARKQGSSAVMMTIGEKRLASDQAVDALSNLYSRGLVQQKELNRFVLTEAGRQLARHLDSSRN
jgi:phage terminase Nu1 subunit (DNA packaging protein)